MPIIGTVGSSYYVPPEYALTATYNTSATHTFSNNTTTFAAYLIGGGTNGNAGSGNGGSGGYGSAAVAFQEVSVAGGSTATVTVAGAAGNSSLRLFGSNVNIASASYVEATSNVSGAITTSFSDRGNGGNMTAYGDNYPAGMGNAGNAGANGHTLTLNALGLPSIQWGGGGGGGGAGGRNANWSNSGARASFGGGTGGSPNGGNGGGGGGVGQSASPGYSNAAPGSAATVPGGGGGGGGGRSIGDAGWGPNLSNDGSGGAGAAGRILIYEK